MSESFDSLDSPMPDEAGTEVVAGREPPPHTQAPDWVSYADVDPLARFLHTILKSHVNMNRGDTKCWPSTRSLAKVLKLSRRDKVAPLLKQLVEVGAIEITGVGMPRRNVYVVHSMPPEDYAGPLTVAAWYEANRAALHAEAAVDKAKREDRKSRQKTKGQVNPVTPDTGQLVTPPEGQLPVTPDTGQLVTPPEGQPVTALEGRKQDVREQDEGEQQTPPASGSAAVVQPTLAGDVDEPKEPTVCDRAFGIANGWIRYRRDDKKSPIAGSNVQHRLKSLIMPFLNAGYRDDEVKLALDTLAIGIPSTQQLERALLDRRDGVGRRRNGRPAAVADVNAAWADKRPLASSSAGAGGDRW